MSPDDVREPAQRRQRAAEHEQVDDEHHGQPGAEDEHLGDHDVRADPDRREDEHEQRADQDERLGDEQLPQQRAIPGHGNHDRRHQHDRARRGGDQLPAHSRRLCGGDEHVDALGAREGHELIRRAAAEHANADVDRPRHGGGHGRQQSVRTPDAPELEQLMLGRRLDVDDRQPRRARCASRTANASAHRAGGESSQATQMWPSIHSSAGNGPLASSVRNAGN